MAKHHESGSYPPDDTPRPNPHDDERLPEFIDDTRGRGDDDADEMDDPDEGMDEGEEGDEGSF